MRQSGPAPARPTRSRNPRRAARPSIHARRRSRKGRPECRRPPRGDKQRPGIAHHRQFRLVRDQLRHRLGDDVVMQHVGDRYAVAGPGANHVAIGAAGVHHMLAADLALIGDHQPFAGVEPADIRDPRAAVNLGAERARTRGHRHGDIGGRHVAVSHGQERRLHALEIEERMMAESLRADDMRFVAGEFRYAVDLPEPVTSSSVQASRMPPQPCQLTAWPVFSSIEDRAACHRHAPSHLEGAVEMRALAGGMPGGARGELALLQQHDLLQPSSAR